MTDTDSRITPAEVRAFADKGDNFKHGVWLVPASFMSALANQMEADDRRLSNAAESWREKCEEIARLRDTLRSHNIVNSDGAYHYWIPDEDNYLETLSCPVVMPAEWLRGIMAERDNLAAKVKEYEERMKGRVLVPSTVWMVSERLAQRCGGQYCARAMDTMGFYGHTPEEAIANLQAAIDEEAERRG